jgi:hypothetical protein
MNEQAVLVLWTVLAFQIKHFLGDFVLQTGAQVAGKGFYGRRGGIEHAATHALLSIPVLVILTCSPLLIAAVAAAEFLVHYHVDWAKARTDRRMGWSNRTRIYWAAFGIDQLLHQLTYLAIVVVLVPHAAA